jgi:hypothetical protein
MDRQIIRDHEVTLVPELPIQIRVGGCPIGPA